MMIIFIVIMVELGLLRYL